MFKWMTMVASLLMMATPSLAAEAQQPHQPVGQPAMDAWTAQPGETDLLHGIWFTNARTGKVYRCAQFSASATCVEAAFMSKAEWDARQAQQQQQQKR
jgi:hypothetical protein